MLPNSIRSSLSQFFDIQINSDSSVSGGSINRSHKIETNQGTFFLKWNVSAPVDFFEVEAKGLELLASANTELRVPEVFAFHAPNNNNAGFLVLEFIDENSGNSSDAQAFGRELARLHKNKAKNFGLSYNNYIGSLPQKNDVKDEWVSFFIEMRINPQLQLAVDSGKLNKRLLANWKRLANQLEDLLPPTQPSLIHGDLWGGNYLYDENGAAVLLDPAVYYGHPEVDLAFTKMFGGFSSPFYEGYHSISPIENGFSERVPIYNMYPLLVHVNLFGGHYISQFQRFIKQF